MFTRCYNCPFHCRHHPFFRELYMQCLIFLKRSQSIPLALHCISSFFFLTCYVELCVDWIFWQEFRSPRLSFADWMGVIFQSCQHFGSKFVFLKSLKTWFMLLLRLKLQRWLVIALTSFSLNDIRWHGQHLFSWTLRTFLALYIFFFLFQFFFLVASIALHKSPFLCR